MDTITRGASTISEALQHLTLYQQVGLQKITAYDVIQIIFLNAYVHLPYDITEQRRYTYAVSEQRGIHLHSSITDTVYTIGLNVLWGFSFSFYIAHCKDVTGL
jgi:hypothetical protein